MTEEETIDCNVLHNLMTEEEEEVNHLLHIQLKYHADIKKIIRKIEHTTFECCECEKIFPMDDYIVNYCLRCFATGAC